MRLPRKNKDIITTLDALFNLASRNDGLRSYKLAAMLSIKGSKPYIGFNSRKTHPLQAKYGKNEHCVHLHAEIDAIRQALRDYHTDDLSGATLYIARAKHKSSTCSDWVWGMAEPCDGCKSAIMAFGIKNVYFTTDIDGEIGHIEK